MKATDLRIGNYVYDIDGDILQIGEILDIGVKFKNTSLASRYEKIQPISITEDILLKCGFDKIIVENYPVYIFDDFMIEIYTDNCVVCYNNSEITKIKFVHSLQNLYFSIKLKELLCDNI